jgi:hypothetical protein
MYHICLGLIQHPKDNYLQDIVCSVRQIHIVCSPSPLNSPKITKCPLNIVYILFHSSPIEGGIIVSYHVEILGNYGTASMHVINLSLFSN